MPVTSRPTALLLTSALFFLDYRLRRECLCKLYARRWLRYRGPDRSGLSAARAWPRAADAQGRPETGTRKRM